MRCGVAVEGWIFQGLGFRVQGLGSNVEGSGSGLLPGPASCHNTQNSKPQLQNQVYGKVLIEPFSGARCTSRSLINPERGIKRRVWAVGGSKVQAVARRKGLAGRFFSGSISDHVF